MARFLRRINSRIIVPTGNTIALGVRLNQLIWVKYFDQAWDSIPMHEKLTWILFLSNTLGVITLLHFIAL